MSSNTSQRPLYRQVYAALCPVCRFRIAAIHTSRFINAIRPRRSRWHGRYVSIRQLRLFIEIARTEVDWNSAWISMDELYQIIEHVSQMDTDDSMDVDSAPLAIQDVVNRFENLNFN
jgi:hypothetical protein